MSLRMVVEINHPRGEPDIYSPRVYCDHCGSVIKSAADGQYLWNPSEAHDGDAKVWFLHNRCADAFRQGHEDITYSTNLDLLPFYLGTVLNVDIQKVEKKAKLVAMFGL